MSQAAEYLSSRKWGVFTHYLHSLICDPSHISNRMTGITDWNEAVSRVDVERLAYSLHRMNVGYYFITLMQGDRYLLAPNATFDSIAGTKPGEACALRDLPMELADALAKYGIDLCLYYTGDGPWKDEIIGNRFGFVAPRENVSMDFVEKWASVLEEYAVRYGDRVKAWWIDGCYGGPSPFRREQFGYTDELLAPYERAIRKGNPMAAIAFNDGGSPIRLEKHYVNEDFTAGESRQIRERSAPLTKYVDGALHHVLFPLGANTNFRDGVWGACGLKHPKEYVLRYIEAMNAFGGIVTVDIAHFIDGSLDPEQEAALRFVGEHITLGRSSENESIQDRCL